MEIMETARPAVKRAKGDVFWVVGTAIMILFAVIRIAPTWTTFTATYDEPFHIAAGMEWLDGGGYSYEWQHPPLARVAVALGPYLMGRRSSLLPTATAEGNAILYSGGDYWGTLRAARLGNVPFLVLACTLVFVWGRRWFSAAAGFWAVVLFVSLPPVLGHAGLATLDVACAATTTGALFCFLFWLERRSWQRSMLLGAALGLAFVCKFSALVFFGACAGFGVFYIFLLHPTLAKKGSRMWVNLIIIGFVTFLLAWAGYRFSVRPLPYGHTREFIPHVLAPLVTKPLPLAQMGGGLLSVFYHNAAGHEAYLLGRFKKTGWWYFFPIAMAVKTPLAVLLLAAIGTILVFRRSRSGSWQRHVTVLFMAAIMLSCMSASVNLGVRHILPIYPLVAILGGHALASMFRDRKSFAPVIAGSTLAALALVDCWIAHPDYLAYFNQLAGNHPEAILTGSDLDWGQDLDRLAKRLQKRGIHHVSIRYFGTAPLEKAGLPAFSPITLDERPHGYVAVSSYYLTEDMVKNGEHAWLKRYVPVEKIGKSIYLFHFAGES